MATYDRVCTCLQSKNYHERLLLIIHTKDQMLSGETAANLKGTPT